MLITMAQFPASYLIHIPIPSANTNKPGCALIGIYFEYLRRESQRAYLNSKHQQVAVVLVEEVVERGRGGRRGESSNHPNL